MYQPTMLRLVSCAKRSKYPEKEAVYPIEVLWKTGMLTLAVSYHELGSGWIDRGKPTLYPRCFAARQRHVRVFP